jgi:hypothetical protein
MIGFPDGTFKPSQFLTRAEIATIITQLMDLGTASSIADLATFPDTISHWAKTYISNASKSGIMLGYPDGTFMPDRPVTRAEVTAIINRLLLRSPKTESEKAALNNVKNPFTDVSRTHWAYFEIMEAGA